MNDPAVQQTVEASPGLSQGQRITYVFTAPSKTFNDIKNGHRSWWLPFLITVLFSYVLFAAITTKIGWSQVAENAIKLDPKGEERLSQASPEQREMTMKFTRYAMEGSFAANPVLALGFVALFSLGIWGTINFVFGGKATYGSIFAVWMYAFLPKVIQAILGIVVIYAGTAPESFNLNAYAPTSIGSFLNPVDTNHALYTLATWIDFVTIWCMVLLSIGVATVAGVKRVSGYIAIFGWWALFLLISVGWAIVRS
jgi:hypothetical protein